jgi:hypothetical protein
MFDFFSIERFHGHAGRSPEYTSKGPFIYEGKACLPSSSIGDVTVGVSLINLRLDSIPAESLPLHFTLEIHI